MVISSLLVSSLSNGLDTPSLQIKDKEESFLIENILKHCLFTKLNEFLIQQKEQIEK